ncbi:MAG: hypothetical protein NTW29_01515 [Bacteroidetes bacterium]|nr:hypothetical protein [Bacteroidota bacterium]
MEGNKSIKKSFLELTNQGLALVKKRLIEKEKKNNGYLVIADKNGVIKKIPASEL